MLILTDILDNLRLPTQLGVILQTLNQLTVIHHDYPQQLRQTRLQLLDIELRHTELQSVRNVPIPLLVTLNQIYTTLNLTMNIIVVRCIQVPPKNVLTV